MPSSASPLRPPPQDINRIVHIRQQLGKENMYDALAPLVLASKPPTVRALAASLQVSSTTAWKLRNSLPLSDISNLSRVNQRAVLRDIVEAPHAVITPSVHPARHQYLTNIELEALVQLIDARAHNQQAIGMSSIRQYAADMRAQRLKVARVRLPSKTWYREFDSGGWRTSERLGRRHVSTSEPTLNGHRTSNCSSRA